MNLKKVLFQNLEFVKEVLFSRSIIPIFFQVVFCGFNRCSLEISRNIYRLNLVRKVTKKIRKIGLDLDGLDKNKNITKKNRVWVYWDSGFEDCPDIVSLCFSRLASYNEVEVICLDDDNLHDYISFPDYVEEKHLKGVIKKAHYSDLVRLELLYKYGGIWLDSTVLLTGTKFPEELLSGKLFLYGMSKPSINGNPLYLSNWAISSEANNRALGILREYFFDYWRFNDKIMSYFLFHVAFCSIFNEYPQLRPINFGFHNNAAPHLLQLNYESKYSESVFNEILKITDIHKLSYKYKDVAENSFLEKLLSKKGSLFLK